ncbi:MAG: hypothetical protein KA419_19630 [Acidobacteria bacterium]|nr:hypothetical protein [Acidobacteriota bacterium]
MNKNLILLAALALGLTVLTGCQQSSTARTDAAVSGTATPTGSASDTWRADSGQAGKVGSGMGQAGGLAGILDLPGANPAPGQPGPTGSTSTGGTTVPDWSQPGAGSTPATVTPSGNYSDIVEVLDRMSGMMERFSRSIQNATSARDVARAMNLLADQMESMKGDIQSVARRHPELGKLKDPPDEIKPAFFRLMKSAGAMQGPEMAKKLQNYAQDPEVQQAAMRMVKAGQAFQELGKTMN